MAALIGAASRRTAGADSSIALSFEAGASLVHIHVRNPDETASSDPALFAQVQEGVRKHCPGMIIQFSTGGRGREQAARGAMLHLKPDMASLATGSVNFPASIYENPPDFVEGLAKTMLDNDIKPEIEVFDLAMLYNAANLVKKGLLKSPPHVLSCSASPTPYRCGAASSTSCAANWPSCYPAPPGSPPAPRAGSSRSTSGASKPAVIAAPAWKTTCASTRRGWPRAMPSW